MKRYLFILIAALGALCARGQLTADWKTYMPFDGWATQVVETPGRVYFMSRTFEYSTSLKDRSMSSNSLFFYDKDGDEVVSVNERANSNGNAVACVGYNAVKKYLLVVYTDCNIDFLYDDGRVFNLPALKATSIPGKKEANFITFDNARNRAYVATTFGYLALNDDKHEVAESRTYGENVSAAARCGDTFVVCVDGKVYFAPAADQRFNISDYEILEGVPHTDGLIPLDGNDFFGFQTKNGSLGKFTREGQTYTWQKESDESQFYGVQQVASGSAQTLTGKGTMYRISSSGDVEKTARPQGDLSTPAATYDGTQLWTLTDRKGLRRYKKNADGWSLEADYMRPNAPATYLATSFAYIPDYGMVCGSNGFDVAYTDLNQQTPSNLSALKGGFWKEYGPYYSGSVLPDVNNYGGMGVDPKNPRHIYRNSTVGGLMRVDLSNPSDVLIMANPSNKYSSREGFIKIADDQKAWNILCRFTTPQFTTDGTMWTLYNNRDADRAELWYWPAADRLATTSASTYRPMKKIPIPEVFPHGNSDVMIHLNNTKNMAVLGGLNDGGTVMFFDYNGTPETTGDDRYVFMKSPVDQDGGGVTFLAINSLFEDPATGLVWIMSQRGLFTVNPATVFENPDRVNRIKVARNDGTNLADYLLNEINVNSMSIDGEGRKWFSTSNGLVCTSADGRTILAEFTTDNSYLPGNNVYATCHNPENGSMMVATDGGLVEMFPSGSGSSSSAEGNGVRAYPNPVEPDFYGWVRIDNIPEGSLVKIADAKGGIVKELGPAQGGSVQWDVSGLNNTRVSTGVYYIMVSPGSNGDGNTQVSKILVLN